MKTAWRVRLFEPPATRFASPLLSFVSRIIMDESLEAAMARLLGAAPPAPKPPASETVPGTVQELIAQAAATYRRAQQLLRQGDLAGYARQMERLGEILRQLESTRQ